MAQLYRVRGSGHPQPARQQFAAVVQMIAALAAALFAAGLLQTPRAAASIPPALHDDAGEILGTATARAAGAAGVGLTLAAEPQWMAIDDDASGITIELPWKWREAAASRAHEREVTQSPGWTFSRLYDCLRDACGHDVRTIISGGLLGAGIDIHSPADLKDQMPRREVARIGALIAGVDKIDPDSLKQITRGAAQGYRLATRRRQDDGSIISIMIDCLYASHKFLILTVVTYDAELDLSASVLDEIEQGIIVDAASANKTSRGN